MSTVIHTLLSGISLVNQFKPSGHETKVNHLTHIVLSLDCGGMERVVLNLVRERCKAGQNVSIVCLERPGTLAPAAEALGAKVYTVNKQPGLRMGIIGDLKRLFAKLKPDVVHTHQIGALFYAGPAARKAGVPVVVHTEHGKHYSDRFRTRLLGRWAARYADRLFAVSRDIAREMQQTRIARPSKITYLPNGIETNQPMVDRAAVRASLNIPHAAFVIGTLGRLNEIKRQDLLIRAFAQVHRQFAQSRLLLVGDGPLLAPLQALVADLGLTGQVCFAGYQDRPEAYLQVMDLFCLSSRSEGMPLAILEAWSAGLPVVASRVGGIPDMIQQGENGLMFESGDEDALVSAINSVMNDPAFAKRLGAAGQDFVRREFDVSRMAQAYDDHYRRLLAANQ